MTALWAHVEVTPQAQRKAHWVLAAVWLAAFPAILILGLEESVPLLVFISVYANFVGHISSAQAAQVEVKQEENEEARLEENETDLDEIHAKVNDVRNHVIDAG